MTRLVEEWGHIQGKTQAIYPTIQQQNGEATWLYCKENHLSLGRINHFSLGSIHHSPLSSASSWSSLIFPTLWILNHLANDLKYLTSSPTPSSDRPQGDAKWSEFRESCRYSQYLERPNVNSHAESQYSRTIRWTPNRRPAISLTTLQSHSPLSRSFPNEDWLLPLSTIFVQSTYSIHPQSFVPLIPASRGAQERLKERNRRSPSTSDPLCVKDWLSMKPSTLDSPVLMRTRASQFYLSGLSAC